MKKIFFGTTASEFERQYISGSNMLNSIYHYKGQLLISDGNYSKPLCDLTVALINKKPKEALELICKQFSDELTMHKEFDAKYKILGANYTYDSLNWLINIDNYPINWFDNFKDAYELYHEEPAYRSVASSKPIDIQ